MTDFLKLVANENMKIYSRVRTWVMLGILALFNVLLPVLISLFGTGVDIWSAFMLIESITFMLNIIFTVVIAADLVAGEFTWGTIKLLLIRPWSRGKILFSKFLAMILFSLFGTGIVGIVGLATSALLFPSISPISLRPEVTGVEGIVLLLLTDYIQLFIISLIAFMISTVFRSASLAIGLSLMLLFTKDLFSFIFNPDRYEWAKYILILHMDLSNYIHSSVGPGGVGFSFSITLIAVYCLIFALVSWWTFTKRDVAS